MKSKGNISLNRRAKKLHTYIRTYVHTYTRTYVCTYVHTHTHTHTLQYITLQHITLQYIHTNTHTHTHTHTQKGAIASNVVTELHRRLNFVYWVSHGVLEAETELALTCILFISVDMICRKFHVNSQTDIRITLQLLCAVVWQQKAILGLFVSENINSHWYSTHDTTGTAHMTPLVQYTTPFFITILCIIYECFLDKTSRELQLSCSAQYNPHHLYLLGTLKHQVHSSNDHTENDPRVFRT
jgi:hypothetical protein